MKKIILCVIIIGTLFSCNGQNENEINLIHTAFKNYKKYALENNGKEAIKWIDSRTIEYYENILQLTRTADSIKTSNLGILDKMNVISMRIRIPKDELLKMTGESLLIYSIDKGMVGKNGIMSIEIKDIQYDGNFAHAQIMNNNQEFPARFHFYEENNVWKIDLTSIFKISTTGLLQTIQSKNMTVDEFILASMKVLIGKEPDNSIWHPIELNK